MITSTLLLSKTLATAVYDDSQEKLPLDFRDAAAMSIPRSRQFCFAGCSLPIPKVTFSINTSAASSHITRRRLNRK
jgi:hypothetical protein